MRALDLFLVGHTNFIIYSIIGLHLFGGNRSDLDVPVRIHTILSNKVHVAEVHFGMTANRRALLSVSRDKAYNQRTSDFHNI